ncbi:uncharacterized protein LOC144165144 [Haemaphysalis longicornis]
MHVSLLMRQKMQSQSLCGTRAPAIKSVVRSLLQSDHPGVDTLALACFLASRGGDLYRQNRDGLSAISFAESATEAEILHSWKAERTPVFQTMPWSRQRTTHQLSSPVTPPTGLHELMAASEHGFYRTRPSTSSFTVAAIPVPMSNLGYSSFGATPSFNEPTPANATQIAYQNPILSGVVCKISTEDPASLRFEPYGHKEYCEECGKWMKCCLSCGVKINALVTIGNISTQATPVDTSSGVNPTMVDDMNLIPSMPSTSSRIVTGVESTSPVSPGVALKQKGGKRDATDMLIHQNQQEWSESKDQAGDGSMAKRMRLDKT